MNDGTRNLIAHLAHITEHPYIPEVHGDLDDAPEPLSPERLAEIRVELGHTESQIAEATGWELRHYKAVQRRFHETRLLLAEVERLRAEMEDRPTRAEVLREAADELTTWLGFEESVRELRRMADAAEQPETGGAS